MKNWTMTNKIKFLKRTQYFTVFITKWRNFSRQLISSISCHWTCSVKKVFTGKRLYWSLFLLKLKTWTPTKMFSCKYYEFFKKTYFVEHLQTTASKTVDAAASINALEPMPFFISMHSPFVLFYPFQTNVAFHIETSHLKCNIGLN